MKYFVESMDADGVQTLAFYKNELDKDLKEIELLETKRDIGGEMWCEENERFVEKGDCDKWCPVYSPCNGKSGRCRSLKNGFIQTGRRFLLTEDGLKEIKGGKDAK